MFILSCIAGLTHLCLCANSRFICTCMFILSCIAGLTHLCLFANSPANSQVLSTAHGLGFMCGLTFSS